MSNFEKQLTIQGIVLCSCGGSVISNTGKIRMKNSYLDNKLSCFRCGRIWNADYAYRKRREGEAVKLDKREERAL